MREKTGMPGEIPRSQVEMVEPHSFLVEVRGVIDDHYSRLNSKEYSTGDFPAGHPSSYQPHPTRFNFAEQTGTGVSFWCKP